MTTLMNALMRGTSGNIFANQLAASQTLGCRAKVGYDQVRFRNKAYRSSAREKRKQMKRDKMASATSVKDSGEDIPPFFLPQRYKLLYRVMEDHKNASRLGRKPMPQEVKQNLAKVAKEYSEFKIVEKILMDKERAQLIRMQAKASDAILMLPDYLLEETLSDSGQQAMEDMSEFAPSVVYMEQMMQMFPPEMTCRLRMIPAFEESLMLQQDKANDQMSK